jgi:hypothetical protein
MKNLYAYLPDRQVAYEKRGLNVEKVNLSQFKVSENDGL